MRKVLFVALLTLLPILAQAQKIDKDFYDQFTGSRIMYTKLEKINWNYKHPMIGGKMQMRFILNDDFQYVELHWVCNNFLEVAEGAKIQFKLDNGYNITLKNEVRTQSARGGTGIAKKDVGVMLNCLGDVPKFATAHVTAIRVYTSSGFYDFEVNWKESERLHRTYMLFSRQMYVGGHSR